MLVTVDIVDLFQNVKEIKDMQCRTDAQLYDVSKQTSRSTQIPTLNLQQ